MKNDFQSHEYDICIVRKGEIYGFNSIQYVKDKNIIKSMRVKKGKEWKYIYYGEINSKNEVTNQMVMNLPLDDINKISSIVSGSIATRDFKFYLQQANCLCEVKQNVR